MSNDLELLVPEPQQLRTQTMFPALATGSPLSTVEVADEAGLAYLVGDIDFGAVGRDEIFQNIRFIVLTEYFSVPLDREFGMDYSMVDKPMSVAEAILAQEVAMKISLYEPRAQFREISFVRDELNGKLAPTVRVVLLTTAELPSSIPTTTTPGAAPLVTIEEMDLPSFYESLISFSKVPGPVGPMGPEGPGQTWRGEYDPAVQYYVDDVVEYNGSSFICRVSSMGVAPEPDTLNNVLPPLANTAHRGSVPPLPLSDQTFYWLRGDNTWQAMSATLAAAFVTLADAATITWTLSAQVVSQNARVTLGGNRTLSLSPLASGMNGTLICKQDGTGGRTLTLPSGSRVINGGGGAMALSSMPNAIDVLTWIFDGTTIFWTYGKNYS